MRCSSYSRGCFSSRELSLLFLITVVIAVIALLRAGYAVVRGRRRVAPRILLHLGAFLGVYAAALIAVSLTSVQGDVELTQERRDSVIDVW